MESKVLDKQRQAICEKGWDALIATSPENVSYSLGFVIPSLRFLRRRLTAVVVTPSARSVLVVVNMEYESSKRLSKAITEVRPYIEFEQEMVDVLVPTLKELGLSQGRIGVESDHLPTKDFEVLKQGLPEAEFINAEKLFLELRMLKTASEIKKLSKVSKASAIAHTHVEAEARAGMEEVELAGIIADALYEQGVFDMDTPTIVSGQRSTLANDGPSRKRLQPGELVRIDILGYVDGYCSDVARTYVVGEPSAEQCRVFSTLVNALQAMYAEIGPGVKTSHLYQIYTKTFEAGGLEPTAFVGHGLGLSVHEDPWISKHSHLGGVLQPNMVLCIEPYTNLGANQGYQLEDTVLITEDGYEILTDVSPNERLLQIQA